MNKPYMTVEYNLTLRRMHEVVRFAEVEAALNWLEFRLLDETVIEHSKGYARYFNHVLQCEMTIEVRTT